MKRLWPIVAYLLVYMLFLAAMHLRLGFGLADPLAIFAVFGVGLSLVALWSTRGVAPRSVSLRRPAAESVTLVGYLLPVVAFLTWGLPGVRTLSTQPVSRAALVTAAKLLVFVIVPFVVWWAAWRYRPRDFVDLGAGLRGHWRPLVAVSLALIGIQFLLGRARTDLAALHPSAPELVAAVAVTAVWLFVEVGVVEEFFFRGLVQARAAAVSGSEVGGLVVAALVFGLAHAPGFYLRPALTGEPLGTHPSLLLAFGYAIVVTSVTGFFMGILWIRTKNLLLLALVHTAGDLLPGLAGTIHFWRPT